VFVRPLHRCAWTLKVSTWIVEHIQERMSQNFMPRDDVERVFVIPQMGRVHHRRQPIRSRHISIKMNSRVAVGICGCRIGINHLNRGDRLGKLLKGRFRGKMNWVEKRLTANLSEQSS
jgi:hypothetical protein